jgi:hypothetical protein
MDMDQPSPGSNVPARKTAKPAPLDQPIEIAKFWKNRRRNESVRIELSKYEGHCLVNVRVWQTGTDGVDRPTPKGIALGIARLPQLTCGLLRAEDLARELGLLGEEGK